MRQFISKPSPAMIVACIALFVGMSGASYAATKIGSSQIKKNAVFSKHIKNGQVKTADLRANAVTAAKVADSSLSGADLADNSVAGEDVKDGTLSGVDVTDRSLAGVDLADNSVDGAKVSDDSLTGADIEESALGQVPDAAKVGGKAPTAFIASDIYKVESAIVAGTDLGDGTFAAEKACNPGDILLSGGPANVAKTSTMVESFPAPGNLSAWKVRINKNAQADNWNVVVLCANQ